MFNNIKRVAAVIALTGWMGVANASLIFDFSYGTTGNELVGEITGLVDGMDGQVQSVVSFRITNATGAMSEFNHIFFEIDSYFDVTYNRFILEEKQIMIADLKWRYLGPFLGADYVGLELREVNGEDGISEYIRVETRERGEYVWQTVDGVDFNGFVLRETPTPATPAPEPSAVFLLALGLAGVSFSRYKKKS
jgi:hypothetical protein